MLITPLHIQLLLHYYCIAEPWHRPSIAATEFTSELKLAGLIKENPESGSGYSITEMGEIHIEAILKLQLPRYFSPSLIKLFDGLK